MPSLDALRPLLPAALVAVTLAGVVLFLLSRRSRERRDTQALAVAIAEDLHPPASLHPLIDPDICIGSLSCIKACPEGDILGIVDGTAKLIIGSNCIGHGRCAIECPVDAIKLVFGTSQRGVDLPEVDEHFESTRSGVHIVGELGGMGLIKNAFRQGLQAADHLRAVLGRLPRHESETDVLIVGAGPAGLATALGCRAHGLTFRLVEQGQFGGSILSYPRHKIVMSEPVALPGGGKFGRSLMSKEDLLEGFEKLRRKHKIEVEEGVQVGAIEGQDGAFIVSTNRGPIAARKVVLAIGRRGTPRRLEVPGAELDKVTYELRDPEQYRGRRVLVVGGGDSALEAAIQLAEQPGSEVSISYRQPVFARCRDANRRRITALIDAGRIKGLLGTQLVSIAPQRIVVRSATEEQSIDNDYVIGCLGGELPMAFLKAADIGMVRHRGERTSKATAGHARTGAPAKRNYLGLALSLIGVAVVGALFFLGREYYAIPAVSRARSPLHELMRPAGLWGHGIGIVATLFMMLNFVYPLRKRLGFLKGTAPIRSWLTFHMFVGIMSPLMIAFHAAFQSRNLLATSTYVALVVVVVTGLFGRFLYGLVPSAEGKQAELGLLKAQVERHQQELGELARGEELQALVGRALEAAQGRTSLATHLLFAPAHALSRWLMLRKARSLFADAEGFVTFRESFLEYEQLVTQSQFYRSLRRLLSGWRAFHVVLSVLLVGIISVHVWLSIYLGYRWIFR